MKNSSRNPQCITTRTGIFLRNNKSESLLINWLPVAEESITFNSTTLWLQIRNGTETWTLSCEVWRHFLHSDIFKSSLNRTNVLISVPELTYLESAYQRLIWRDLFRKGLFHEQKRNESSRLRRSVREDYYIISDVMDIDSQIIFSKDSISWRIMRVT